MSSDQEKAAPPGVAPSNLSWKEQFVAFVNTKVPNSGVCKECGEKNIVVSDDIVTVPLFTSGGIALGGPAYPQAMLICTNCGNTRFFNVVVSGVLSETKSV